MFNAQNEFIEIDDLEGVALVVRTGQKLLRQIGGTCRRSLDFLNVALYWGTGWQRERYKFGAAADAAEQIIDIMDDPTSLAADSVKLLELREPCFEEFELGHVTAHHHD